MSSSPNSPKPLACQAPETLTADASRARIEQLIEALGMSLEDKATAVFSTLARAAFEGTHQPDARHTCGDAELRNVARLTRAGSRIRDARTRLRVTCSKPKSGKI